MVQEGYYNDSHFIAFLPAEEEAEKKSMLSPFRKLSG